MKKRISYIVYRISSWIKNNPVEFWVLLAILIVGAFMRLYRISEYMTFLGDEGRDVIIVRRLLIEGHTPLIGPGTSIGSMYLGPLYYYMMAPALLIANFSPVGPAVQIALLGIVTIWLVWYIGREWFSKSVGIIAAAFYAVSPTVIIYSRSSWNPDIMPFFSLLSIYSIWRVWKKAEYKWLIITGVAFAFVLQSHYLGLLLAPTIFILWFLFMRRSAKNASSWLLATRYSLLAISSFLILMSPLIIFDLRHNFVNARAMYQFFTVRQTTVSARPWSAIPKVPQLFNQINTSLLGVSNLKVGAVISIFLFLGIIFSRKRSSEFWILFSWYAFALIGFGIYKQNIYDHYFGFMFVVPFLLLGIYLSKIIELSHFGKILGILILIYLLTINFQNNPLRLRPNNQLRRAKDVAQKISTESSENEFNLAVLAERNYQDGYKYFLLNNGVKVVEIDAQRPQTIKNQLFVVCEMLPEKCDPTHASRAEVANFGWSKIESTWEVDGVLLYKLVHSK